MRLLTVSHFFESHGGGIERVAGHVSRELAALGHEAAWAASAADPAPADAAISAVPLRCVNPTERLTGLPMPIPVPSGLAALSRAIRRADAVIVHDAMYCTSISAMVLARRHRKPVILIQHIAAIEFASPTMRHLMRLANRVVTRPMLKMADRSVFISDTVMKAFADAPMKRPPSLLFNGVDTAIFHPAAPERERLGLPATGTVAAFVGRFVTKKGLAVLRALAGARPELTIVMAGSGPIDPAQWQLPNVRLVGPLDAAGVAALFRSSDMLLLPSVGEGYPLVIQEALACGLPVVCGAESAAADPGASRWLRGVAIDLGDPDGTANRIGRAIDRPRPDPKDRAEMAAYARHTYRWSAKAEALACLADEMVRGSEPRSAKI